MDINYEDAFYNNLQKYEEAGVRWAEMNAQANHLKEIKKSILSGEILKQDPGMSFAEKESRGLISPIYRQHLDGLKEAQAEADKLWVFLELYKMKHEALRSLSSRERSQMEMT